MSLPGGLPGASKIIFAPQELFAILGYYGPAGLVGYTHMRAIAFGLFLSAAACPCLAQTVLKSEPLVLGPYESAFVQDTACPSGKVLKVTGAIRGLHRRKACVALASEQASLAAARP